MIDTRRKHVNFGVGESQKIQVWEAQVGNDGTPLLACYNNWKKVTQLQHAKKVSEQQKLDDYSHIPQLKKKKMRMKEDTEPEVGGFLSGSDDDSDDDEFEDGNDEEEGDSSDEDSDDESD